MARESIGRRRVVSSGLALLAGLVAAACAPALRANSGGADPEPSPTPARSTSAPTSAPVTPSPEARPSVAPREPVQPGAPATVSAAPTPIAPTPVAPTPIPTAVPPPTRWAVIGDYGEAGPGAKAVADLVIGWQPDFIITTGDNNYPHGEAATIDRNVGQYYRAYIYPYKGTYGAGADRNRFFPSLGNHDWESHWAQPYLDYFTLPGHGRYYTFSWGSARFFALDSMPGEPDGVRSDSRQAHWLQRALATSSARWNIVYMHHPPYSSGRWGNSEWMQWPYQQWGADLVLAGHDHTYERLVVDRLPYIVNGLGGTARYPQTRSLPSSQLFFNEQHGALFCEADDERLRLRFVTVDGRTIDTYELRPRR